MKIDTERPKHPVLFTFNEGFTNAVRRPVYVNEFIMRAVEE